MAWGVLRQVAGNKNLYEKGQTALKAQKTIKARAVEMQKQEDKKVSIIAGVAAFVLLAAIGAGLTQHFVGFQNLHNVQISVVQGVAFLGLPAFGGIIIIGLAAVLTPKAVRKIKRARAEQKTAEAKKKINKPKQQAETEVKKKNSCCGGCGSSKKEGAPPRVDLRSSSVRQVKARDPYHIPEDAEE